MPVPLKDDAIAFLQARQAPITASNVQNMMTFLQENPDKRPSYGSKTTPASFAGTQSGSDIEAADERNMNATMGGPKKPRIAAASPNTNDVAQSTLTETVGAVNEQSPGTAAQANVQEPARQPLPDIGDGQQHFAGDPSLSPTAALAPIAALAAGMGAARGQGARMAPKALPQLAAPEAVAMLPPPARALPTPNANNRPPLPANEQRSREVINRRNTEASKMAQGSDTAIPMGTSKRTGSMDAAIASRKKPKSKSKTQNEDAVGAGR